MEYARWLADRNDMSEPRGNLRSNTLWAFAADGTQIVLTLAAFFWLSRFLGKSEFGLYSAAISICGLSALIGYMGAQQILMVDLSNGGSFAELWSRLVSTVLLGGTFVTLVLIGLQPLLLKDLSRLEVGAIALSQVVFFGFSEFALVAAQAQQRMSAAFAVRLSSGLIRLAAVALFVLFSEPKVSAWVWYALATWMVSGFFALLWVRLFFGSWPGWAPPDRDTVRRGVPFVVGGSTATILSVVDQPMLLNLGGPTGKEATGIYAVGYKLAAFSAIPITALVRASDYDFYAVGGEGRKQARGLAIRMTALAASYGALAGIALFAISGFVDDILGEDYSDTQTVLRFLAPLAFIKALQIFPANALTGSGQQSARNRVLTLALVLNLGLNIALIPKYTWRGAIVATLVAEVVMAILFWVALTRSVRTDSSDESP